MKISVAMAAYKGEKYIEAQLCSILPQLNENDEIIVSDDCPTEAVEKIINNLNDQRIKYVAGPGKGVIKNFENAISLSTGDYIFLCDQDDVWCEDKVSTCVSELQNGATLVMHDAKIVDSNLNLKEESFFKMHQTKLGIMQNILRNSYIGCCMAFSSEIKKYILPFPKKLPMHDQWIGLMVEKNGKVKLIDKTLILYRRHDETVTGGKTSTFDKVKWRIQIIKAIIGG